MTLSPFLLGGVRGFLLASIPEVEVGQGESFRSNVWKIQVELGSRSFGADLDQGSILESNILSRRSIAIAHRKDISAAQEKVK